MTSTKLVREFLQSNKIFKDNIAVIYRDVNKASVRFKVIVYKDNTQELANSIGEALFKLGAFKISISRGEIVFSFDK